MNPYLDGKVLGDGLNSCCGHSGEESFSGHMKLVLLGCSLKHEESPGGDRSDEPTHENHLQETITSNFFHAHHRLLL
jgi:hypothetical protein